MSSVKNIAYQDYIQDKTSERDNNSGFEPVFMPDYLFGFQKSLCDWAIHKGRSAIFADCGLGKSIMELVWATNVVMKTNGKVLLITPIAVGSQMIREAEKFGISDIGRSKDGSTKHKITVTNYERLHYFNPDDFVGVVLDESSILKNFKGHIKHELNIFMRKIKYRLLATATAAPNDFIELGTSSESLGYLGYMDMLSRFFKNDQNNCATNRRGRFTEATKWRLKGHADKSFWRWITSWARAIRRPSDMGFDDGGFDLPELVENEHEIRVSRKPMEGEMFTFPAIGLKEVRDERRATIKDRCEKVAEKINSHSDYSVVWCNLNDEGDLLEKLIPDAIQVSGKDNDDSKESKLLEFTNKDARVLITKPKIGAFGLNWQHCNHVSFFPAYSYEQYYQAIRRCWRFGQKRNVTVECIYTEGDKFSMENLRRKQCQADQMFSNLVSEMNNSLHINNITDFDTKTEIPQWA
ncbi:MAG: helicase [Proteobacteria bacterium]|nr:helicase [Pseudomonadota bacterium]